MIAPASSARTTGPVLALIACLWIGAADPEPAIADRGSVTGRNARIEVITPTPFRLQYSASGRFEPRPTLTTGGRLERRPPRFRTEVRKAGTLRVVKTKAATLCWRRGVDGFGERSLRLELDGRKMIPRPGPNPKPLGGWRRSLDLVDGPVPLHEGMLSAAGWYLLDDSETALITDRRAGYSERPRDQGAYEDLYLFAYG